MPSLDLLFTILGTIFTHHEKVLPLPSLPPDGSDPAAADPNGAYCVNLETGANNSQVPPERQQEIMNQTQEEQYQFHQTADAPGTFRATNPDHNFQFTHSADRLTLTPTFNDTTKTVEFQDPARRTLLGYRDLHVYDRTGRELSSAMALDTSGLTPSITLQTDVHDALFIEYAFSLNIATWFVLGTGLLPAILTSRVRHYGISRNVLLISMALVLALAINPHFFLRYRGEES